MLRDQDRLLDLIAAIHAAAADPEPAAWSRALERLCDSLGGGLTMLVEHRFPGTIVDLAEARCPPEWVDLVHGRFNEPGTNPLMSALPLLPISVPVAFNELVGAASPRIRGAFDDFFRILQVALLRGGRP